MTKCAPWWRLFLLLLLSFSFAGCSPFKRGTVSEEKDPHFLEGKKRASSMDWDGAIESFERALQSNPKNAAAHFELGVLYDQRKNDFGAAIYHYQRHLKLRPDSPMAEMAKTYIVACQRELAKSVLFALVPRDMQQELERYNQTNTLLKQQIAALQSELARRPRYITNYVTNLVQIPQFTGRDSRLTQPATLVSPEELERAQAPIAQAPPPAAVVQPRAQERRNLAGHQQTRPRGASNARSPANAAAAPRKVHRVRPGDTLERIARLHGVSVAALKAANPAARKGARAGQQIIIPSR